VSVISTILRNCSVDAQIRELDFIIFNTKVMEEEIFMFITFNITLLRISGVSLVLIHVTAIGMVFGLNLSREPAILLKSFCDFSQSLEVNVVMVFSFKS
jgi:hypothetical protein